MTPRTARLACLGLAALAGAACATQAYVVSPPPPPDGQSKGTALPVCGADGAQEWTQYLRCPSGRAPAVLLLGSVGPRTGYAPGERVDQDAVVDERRRLGPHEPDHHRVDVLSLDCGGALTKLYVDTFHCGEDVPELTLPGLERAAVPWIPPPPEPDAGAPSAPP